MFSKRNVRSSINEYADLNEPDKKKKNECGCSSGWLFVGQCFCHWLALTVLILAIVIPVLWTHTIPKMVQTTSDSSKMVLTGAMLFDATADSVMLAMNVTVYNLGGFDASIIPQGVADVKYKGKKFGETVLPSFEVIANEATEIESTAKLKITDALVFQESASRTLNGLNNGWDLECKSHVHIKIGTFKLHTTVTNRNRLELPPSRLQDVRCDGVVVDHANATHLVGKTNVTFYSYSFLGVTGPDDCVVELRDEGDYILGYAQLPSMTVKKGYNVIPDATVIITQGSPNLNKILSNYVNGIDTKLRMIGPISTKATILKHLLDQEITLAGTQGTDLARLGMLTESSVTGWNTGKNVWFRGAVTTVLNPLNVAINFTKVDIYVDFYEPLNFVVKDGMFGLLKKFTCHNISQYAHIYLAKGFNKTSPERNYWELPGNYGRSSTFLPSIPQPGQDTGYGPNCKILNALNMPDLPYSCCYVATTAAAACKAKRYQKTPYFDLKLKANFTTSIQGFIVNLTYSQPWVPLMFGDEITSGFLGDGEVNCNDFKELY